MNVIALRLDTPLMSFGAPIVDQIGEIQSFPAHSMITGLIANALGYEHGDFQALQYLQERLRHASREDRRGQQITDYQTVDLSKPYMDDEQAWTTYGKLEKRKGGTASSATHQRFRDYWADAVHTISFTLKTPNKAPTLENVAEALRNPSRPLFLGRKPCLPATPLFLGIWQGKNVLDVLEKVPLSPRGDKQSYHRAWWPADIETENSTVNMKQPVTDSRDWANQIHVGERWIAEGEIKVEETGDKS